MNEKCLDCIKNDVCKFMEDFNDFVENTKLVKNEVANVEVNCKFKAVKEYYTIRDYPTFPQGNYPSPLPPIITYTGSETGCTDGDNITIK